MSWECETCHKIATGKTHMEAFHYGGSRGRCETCGKGANCADCHCQGKWNEAHEAAHGSTKEQMADLKDILADTA